MKTKQAPLSTVQTVDSLTPQLAWAVALDNTTLRALDRYPSDAERIQRGATLITTGKVTLHATHATVQSGRPEVATVYTVNGACQCEASGWARERGDTEYRCSHKWARALYRKALGLLTQMHTATYQADPTDPDSADVYGFLHALPENSGYAFQYDGGFRVIVPTDARLVIHARCAWVEDGQYVGYVPAAATEGRLRDLGVTDFSHLAPMKG